MLLNRELRARARASLREVWPAAMLVFLLSGALSMATQVSYVVWFTPVYNEVIDALYGGHASAREIWELVQNSLTSPGAVRTAVLALLALLLTPALSLGRIQYALHRIRGQEGSFLDLLSRLRCMWKALALQVLLILRVLAAALPGVALMLLPLWLPRGSFFSSILIWGGGVLAMVMAVRVGIRLLLAPIILSDDPENSVLGSMRLAREISLPVQGNLFAMVGFFLLLNYAASIVCGLISGVAGTVADLAVSLFITVYMVTSLCVFYDVWRLKRPVGEIVAEWPGAAEEAESAEDTEAGDDSLN